MQVSADVKLIPKPPALVDKRNTFTLGSSLKASMFSWRSSKPMDPSSLENVNFCKKREKIPSNWVAYFAHYCGKILWNAITNFTEKSTLLLKKLLKRWFHGNFFERDGVLLYFSMGNSGFFYHSDFTWNKFGRIEKF